MFERSTPARFKLGVSFGRVVTPPLISIKLAVGDNLVPGWQARM